MFTAQRRFQIDEAMMEIIALGASPDSIAILAYECGLTETDVRQLLDLMTQERAA